MNIDIRKRFVNDNNLPIQVLDSPYFDYFLDLYEEDYKSKTKWENLKKEIGDKKPGAWLDEYYETRNKIITDIENSEAYQNFIGDKDFQEKYKIPGEIKGDIYTGNQVGQRFVSIDLREANFQSLYTYDPEIVRGAETYQDFIKLYSDSEYLQESKYTRQVIFGKLNVKRQITIEKWLVWRIYEELKDLFNGAELFSRQTDELIFKLPEDFKVPEYKLDFVRTKMEVFRVDMIQAFTHEGTSILGFIKNYENQEKKPTLHKTPVTFFPQMYKIWKGLEIDRTYDLVLLHDKSLAHFDYQLSKIKL